eukprot:364908-Chlamydomonas_euryale.AAC.5
MLRLRFIHPVRTPARRSPPGCWSASQTCVQRSSRWPAPRKSRARGIAGQTSSFGASAAAAAAPDRPWTV